MRLCSNPFARRLDAGGSGDDRGGRVRFRRSREPHPIAWSKTKPKKKRPSPRTAKSLYNKMMQVISSKRTLKVSLAAAILAAGGVLSAQAPPAAPPAQQPNVIRRAFDIITTDVIVRDNKGQFVADLKKDEFEV